MYTGSFALLPPAGCNQEGLRSGRRVLRHRLLKPLIESVSCLGVAGQGRSDIHDQPAVRHKPKMLAFEIAKALRDQTGCDHSAIENATCATTSDFCKYRSAIARGTACSAQGIEGIGLRRCPRLVKSPNTIPVISDRRMRRNLAQGRDGRASIGT